MIKKSIGVQITILLALGTALFAYVFYQFNTPFPILNVILINLKYFVIPIAVMCYLSPLSNLLCQMSEKNKNYYDESPYKKLVKAYIHLSSILIMFFLFGWIFVFISLLFLKITNDFKISFIIPSIIIFVAIFVVDALFQKHLKVRWYNVFYWVK